MKRDNYTIFSEGRIGHLTLPNRLVRSSTWDPCILGIRRVTDEVIGLYRALAMGGVGLIITGGLPVFRERFPDEEGPGSKTYSDLCIEGIEKMVQAVHHAGTGCKIVAQLEVGCINAGPSEHLSPFAHEAARPLAPEEIRRIVDCFVEGIMAMKQAGFDGVQLHAAHGGLLSQFLSPYTNRRTDGYGGSAQNRARIVREIVSKAREKVRNLPILIKVNCTDYVEGGIDQDTFPEMAREIENLGVDAIETSGGMWDCLVRSKEELGFRPVPSPESHTRIGQPGKQSYFLKYAEKLDLNIPVILVGGNRDVERLEAILRRGTVDFIALCRPLISEPDLPKRWLEGRGSPKTDCISCNSCLYAMIMHPGRPEPGLVTCIFKRDKSQYKAAQEWLASWVQEHSRS